MKLNSTVSTFLTMNTFMSFHQTRKLNCRSRKLLCHTSSLSKWNRFGSILQTLADQVSLLARRVMSIRLEMNNIPQDADPDSQCVRTEIYKDFRTSDEEIISTLQSTCKLRRRMILCIQSKPSSPIRRKLKISLLLL
jgi:hypothetical protein